MFLGLELQAVQEFYRLKVARTGRRSNLNNLFTKTASGFLTTTDIVILKDSSVVVATKSDLHGYNDDNSRECGSVGNEKSAVMSLVYNAQSIS
ncbi:hypothetical protein BVC80_1639g6 [Macleaya cordata]|uniref:Uncharacterized protein n=1 Tax=Macleaya cordata TaxID=56857 RepID=A0A200Q6M4_MACCD|nr:hypothetical protein BVC80_1639g6 [Macleaya cordata]